MLVAIDWANLSVAAAFIAGCVVGAVAVSRIVKMAMDYLKEKD